MNEERRKDARRLESMALPHDGPDLGEGAAFLDIEPGDLLAELLPGLDHAGPDIYIYIDRQKSSWDSSFGGGKKQCVEKWILFYLAVLVTRRRTSS